MADQTFTSGQILTAAQMTTLQSNIGLTWISTNTFTATATKQFTSLFTSAFTDYRVLFSYTASAGTAVYLRWLVGTTVQTGNILSQKIETQLSAGTVTAASRADQYGLIPPAYMTYPSTYALDIYSPQATAYTAFEVNTASLGVSVSDSILQIGSGRNVTTTSFDGFEITTAGAPTLTGTMTLYGYRK